jgi:hypothetical protein
MGQQAQNASTYDSPIRLDGALAPATALGNSVTKFRRVQVRDAAVLHVVADVSSVTGDPSLAIHPMNAAATQEEGTGARLTTDAPTAVTLVNGENEINYTPQGEAYVEIEVISDANDLVTIDFIDVFTRL